MSETKRFFPFNAEQTINILSEFGPLVTMFVVNFFFGVTAGTWSLIVTTLIAIAVMFYMFRRPPMFPLIASAVTIAFGSLTIVTSDPMWIKIKVTLFNAVFALFLIVGLYFKKNFFKSVFEKTFHYTDEGWNKFTWSFAIFFILTALANEYVRLNFVDERFYDILGRQMDGLNVWFLFKIAIILPVTGLYALVQTRIMQKYRVQRVAAE